MTDTRTKAQRVIPERLHYVHGYGFAIGSQAINVGGDGEITDAKQSLLDAYNGMREALLAIPDDPAPQPTPTERDVIQWVSDTVGLSTDNEREMARRLAALRGGDAERAVLLELREAIQEREDANQRNWRAGITPCKDPAILHGCSVANNDVIEIIDRLLAAAPDQADAGKVEPVPFVEDGRRDYTFRLAPSLTDRCHDCEYSLHHDAPSQGASCRRLQIEIADTRKSRCPLWRSDGFKKVEPAASPPADADREARAVLGKITPEQIAEGEQAVRDGKWISTTDLRKELDADREARIVEALAELEHDQWMHWAKTLTEKEPLLSAERVARWKTCMVPYSELTEEMKEHDRVWARKAVAIVSECAAVDAEIAEIRQERIDADREIEWEAGSNPLASWKSDADREARIAEWLHVATTDSLNDSYSGLDREPFRVFRFEINEALALMRTAPASRSVSDLLAEVSRLTTERNEALAECDRLRVALDEREGDMHVRIRAGYDKTVADSWRAEVERLTRERDNERRCVGIERNLARSAEERVAKLTRDRDEARAELLRVTTECVSELTAKCIVDANKSLRAELDRERGGWDALVTLGDDYARRRSVVETWEQCRAKSEELAHCDYLLRDIDTLLAARPAKGEERTDG